MKYDRSERTLISNADCGTSRNRNGERVVKGAWDLRANCEVDVRNFQPVQKLEFRPEVRPRRHTFCAGGVCGPFLSIEEKTREQAKEKESQKRKRFF